MKRRKFIMVFAVVMLLSACGTSQQPADGGAQSDTSAQEGSDKLNIFFTNAYLTSPYAAGQASAMRQYAAANNINLQIVDGQDDAQIQLDQIKNAVTQGVDGIIWFPGDQASTIPVVKFLDESGVPFVVVNSKVDESVQHLVPAYVGSDYREMGKIAGQMALNILGDSGGNIAIINGMLGTEAQLATCEGFFETIAVNPNIKIIADQAADWDTAKAMAVMEDYLIAFGDEIDLVFPLDSGMVQGAASAMVDAGVWGKIPVITSDQGQFVLDAIANGEMSGTAMQDPQQEGELALATIIKLIRGEPVDKWVKLPTGIIDQSNASQFYGY